MKRVFSGLLITLLVAGLAPSSGRGVNAEAPQAAPPANWPCITMSNDEKNVRRLTAKRSGSNVRVGFIRTSLDDQADVARYEIYVLHDQAKAKWSRGDKILPWGPCHISNDELLRSPGAFSSNAYKVESTWSCPSSPCNLIAVDVEIKKVRDEANGAAVIGYDSGGRVVLRLYRAFNEKLDGTFSGKLQKWACNVAAYGEPTATSWFLGTKVFLDGIGLATFSPAVSRASSFAGLALDTIASGVGVDPNTGQVRGKITFTATPSGSEKVRKGRALSEKQKQDLGALVEQSAGAIGEKLGARIDTSKLSQNAKAISSKAVSVTLDVYFVQQSARAFINSLADWSEKVKEVKNLCKVWSGNL